MRTVHAHVHVPCVHMCMYRGYIWGCYGLCRAMHSSPMHGAYAWGMNVRACLQLGGEYRGVQMVHTCAHSTAAVRSAACRSPSRRFARACDHMHDRL